VIWTRWLPWRFVVRRVAKAHGFLDPIALMNRLQSLTQPSEVAVPTELLRAGVFMHARGLINSRVIQHNLDWVWPYWVQRQFDPGDGSFVPRAFSITHINLTHRNWTAVGLPDLDALPVVDPAGLLMPRFDGWSLDAWLMTDDGRMLAPSRVKDPDQRQDVGDGPVVTTETGRGGLWLTTRADVVVGQGGAGDPVCRYRTTARSDTDGWLVLALRPYNPEGISLVHRIAFDDDRRGWTVDDKASVRFDRPAERHHVSDYFSGDVFIHLADRNEDEDGATCDVGLATAAAMFRVTAGQPTDLTATVPLVAEGPEGKGTSSSHPARPPQAWSTALAGSARLDVPDPHFRFLYDAAVRSLVLHSPGDVYPGPFTYKRFWFRDAAFIIEALLAAGLAGRAERALDRFPDLQTPTGYFRSQEGEWDSNGAALWALERFARLTGKPVKEDWRSAIVKGARWIERKRKGTMGIANKYDGLFPAGFSAEHLGPNDYYYWDDYFGVAGLRAASTLARSWGDTEHADAFAAGADDFHKAIDRTLVQAARRLKRPAIPAAPDRRLDAGAIGSLAASYPLRLLPPDDPRIVDLATYLMDHHFVDGSFFQDMIHSGCNAYLTLHVAQTLMRAGDPRFFDLVRRVAEIASPTGQWPEAVHPRTGGGCMGDGHHVWAAAEWVMMLRAMFVREEGDGLVLASGLPAEWLSGSAPLSFGPTPTPWGPITVTVRPAAERVTVAWTGEWRDAAPPVEVRLPGLAPATPEAGAAAVDLVRGTPA
jgi:hypothetical protein